MRLPVRMQSINEKLAEKQILFALDQGVNYFDTAYPYHSGKSESFLGKLFSQNGHRDKVKIATKLPHWSAHSRQDMDQILDEQLSKLKTDRIDYYLIHGLVGESWEKAKGIGVIEFLDHALKKGKIINAGFSFHGLAKEFNEIVDDYDWTFCQIQYNFLDTKNQAGTAGLMYLAQNGGVFEEMQSLASICEQCEECLEKCPQHLPIPDLLKDVQADMEGFLAKPLIWLGKRMMKVKQK